MWDVVNRRMVDASGRPAVPGSEDEINFAPWRAADDDYASDPIPERLTRPEAMADYAEYTKPEPWDAGRIIDTILGVPLLPLKVLSGLDQAVKGGLGIHTLADDAAQAEAFFGGKEYDRPDAIDRFIGQVTGDPRRQVEAAARIQQLAKDAAARRKTSLLEERLKQQLVKGSLDIGIETAGMPYAGPNAINEAELKAAQAGQATFNLQQSRQWDPRRNAATVGQAEHNLAIGEEFDRPGKISAATAAELANRLARLRLEKEEGEQRAVEELRNALQGGQRAPGSYSLLDPGQAAPDFTEPGAVTKWLEIQRNRATQPDASGLDPGQRQGVAERAAAVQTQATKDAIARVNAAIDRWTPKPEDVEASKQGFFEDMTGYIGRRIGKKFLASDKDRAANKVRTDLNQALLEGDITSSDAELVAGGGAKIEDVTRKVPGKYTSPALWDEISADIRGQAVQIPQPTPTPTDDAELNAEFKLRWNAQNPAGGENTQVYRDALEKWKTAKRAQRK